MLRRDIMRQIALGLGLALFSTQALPQQKTAGQRVAEQAQQQRDQKLQREVLEQKRQLQDQQLRQSSGKGCLILVLGAGFLLASLSAAAAHLCW